MTAIDRCLTALRATGGHCSGSSLREEPVHMAELEPAHVRGCRVVRDALGFQISAACSPTDGRSRRGRNLSG
jgi:hypothetical protein